MIRLSKSVVGKKEAEAVAYVIENIGYLGMGATVGEFEHALEDYIGGGFKALCVNSGTAASGPAGRNQARRRGAGAVLYLCCQLSGYYGSGMQARELRHLP